MSLGLLTGFGADVAADTAPIIGLLRKNSKFARFVLGIQRELPGQIVVEANFIRATGYDLPVSRNLNFVPVSSSATIRRRMRRQTLSFPRRFQTRSGISFPGQRLQYRDESRVGSRCFTFRSSPISGFRNTMARIATTRFSYRSTSASLPT